MFDEFSPKTADAPGNLPTEPVDMFAQVEHDNTSSGLPDALSSGLLRKKETDSSQTTLPTDTVVQSGLSGGAKFAIGFFSVLALGGIGYGGLVVYQKMTGTSGFSFVKSVQPLSEVVVTNTFVNIDEQMDGITTQGDRPTAIVQEISANSTSSAQLENTSSTQETMDAILLGVTTDTDGDGLTDSREKELGTDANSNDTDADQLYDGDEVMLWSTNPKNPDSDGDHYPDGIEVKNGYNPLGPGRLIQTQAVTTTTSIATTTR